MADAVAFRHPAIVPYLTVDDGESALAFYREAFGATLEEEPIRMPDGKVGHSNLRVGEAVFMVSDAFPEVGVRSPMQGTTSRCRPTTSSSPP